MNEQGQPTIVPISGLVIAFLIPLAFAGVVMLLLVHDGPHEVVLAGVPRDEYGGLEVAPNSEAVLSREDAIARAMEEARAPEDTRVRQVALGRYSTDAYNEPLRGRLVWFINFANPDEVSNGAGSCGVGSPICTCYWSYHARYVYSAIDATTGEYLFQAEGGGLDPSRPPRADLPPVTQDERDRCETLLDQERKAARDSLTP